MTQAAVFTGDLGLDLKPRGRAVTVFIPEDVHENLRDLAAVNERSLSAEVRYLLRGYTEEPESFA